MSYDWNLLPKNPSGRLTVWWEPMQQFVAVETLMCCLESRICDTETKLGEFEDGTLGEQVIINRDDIAALTVVVNQNRAITDNNTAQIALNTADIIDHNARITQNESDILTNASGISDNASDIANNASGISTNASDIAALTSRVAANEANWVTVDGLIWDLEDFADSRPSLYAQLRDDSYYSLRIELTAGNGATVDDKRFSVVVDMIYNGTLKECDSYVFTDKNSEPEQGLPVDQEFSMHNDQAFGNEISWSMVIEPEVSPGPGLHTVGFVFADFDADTTYGLWGKLRILNRIGPE